MVNLLESRRRILLTTPHLESPTPANPLTFKSNMTTKLKEGKVYFTPIQEGTGDPSPDNVRPITGWDGITVTKRGKNLVDIEDMKATYPWSTATYTAYPIYVGPNKTVTVSYNWPYERGRNFYAAVGANLSQKGTASVPGTQWLYHSTGVQYTYYHPKITVTTDENGYIYINVYAPRNDFTDFAACILDNDFQVEFGEESTTYEPYTETKITIPFPQTIYGGYVDLVNGEVVETHYYDALTSVNDESLSSKYNTDSSVFFWCATNYAFVGNRSYYVEDLKCETLKPVNTAIHNNPSAHLNEITGRYNNNQVVCMIMLKSTFGITDDDTLAEMKVKISAWLSESPIKISYELATPIHYTIDPQVIRPLKGVNNIWSDANGNIEIKFWKH